MNTNKGTQKPLDLQTMPLADLSKHVWEALRGYIAAVSSDDAPRGMQPDLDMHVLALLDFEVSNISDYLDTCAIVLKKLSDPSIGAPFLKALGLPYNDQLRTIMQRVIYFCTSLLESQSALAVLKLESYELSGIEEHERSFAIRDLITYQHATAAVNQLTTLNQ